MVFFTRYLKFSDSHNDLMITVIARITRATSKKETRNLLKRANSCIHFGNGGLFEHLTEDNTYKLTVLY